MAVLTKQRGFHVVELIIAAAVVLVAGVAAWRVWDASHKTSQANSQPTKTAQAIPTISTPKDLDTVNQAVDQIDTGSSLKDLDSLQQEIDAL